MSYPVCVDYRNFSKLSFELDEPFRVGCRHYKVAFCDGEQNTLKQLAQNGCIYPLGTIGYGNNQNYTSYEPLTFLQRIKHFTLGLFETLGYLTVALPFIFLALEVVFIEPADVAIKANSNRFRASSAFKEVQMQFNADIAAGENPWATMFKGNASNSH